MDTSGCNLYLATCSLYWSKRDLSPVAVISLLFSATDCQVSREDVVEIGARLTKATVRETQSAFHCGADTECASVNRALVEMDTAAALVSITITV